VKLDLEATLDFITDTDFRVFTAVKIQKPGLLSCDDV
jgi:hypothetical protein